MKKFIIIIFFIAANAQAFINNKALNLIDMQTQINDNIIHNAVQTEIAQDEISEESYLLIKNNEKLKEDLKEANQITQINSHCHEDPTDPPKKKKKKSKIKDEGEWIIGGMFEINQLGNYEKYDVLEAPLSSSDYNQMYNQWLDVSSYDELKQLIKTQTQNMDKNEFLSYISEMTDRLPYNDDKASFKQGNGTQNPDTLWSMIQEEKKAYAGEAGFGQDDQWGGVCGDIHFAALMIGEIARPEDYEYFTASYVVAGSQHVYMFAIDKNTGQAVVVNYNHVQKVDNPNGIESLAVKNDKYKGNFNNIGTNLRIFANSDGDAKHIATLKSALGSFLYQAVTDEYERIGTPLYHDFMTQQVQLTNTYKEVKTKKSGEEKSYEISKGVKLLHGTRQNGNINNTDIWTLVYYRKKTTNTDGQGNITNPKRLGKESNFSISNSAASLGNINLNENLYVMQVNYTYGLYKSILKTDKVDIQANGRMNLSGDFYTLSGFHHYDDNYNPVYKTLASGDGNLETSIGLSSQVKISPLDYLKATVNFDQSIGVNKEKQLYDWGYLPKNVKLTANALRAGIGYRHQFSPKRSIAVNANYIGTQVGGLYNISTTYQDGKKYIFINYKDDAPGINSNITSNLLPNPGPQLTLGAGAKDVKIKNLTADIGGNITYLPDHHDFFIGGKISININKKKEKLPPEFTH